MPELPEVETVRRDVAPFLTGRLIKSARRVEAPPGPKYHGLERAAGQRVREVQRRGKFLVMPLSKGDELVVHLGMTGALLREKPDDHLRVTLTLDRGALYFRDPRRFGRCVVLAPGERGLLPSLLAMGPEPLEASFTPAVLGAGLARSRAAVKAVLLSQKAVAGVGNIYADEALFRAGIHPEAVAQALSATRVARLCQAIREVLAAGVADGGTTLSDYRRVDGSAGEHADALQVYGRDGEPCVRCGKTLQRTLIGQRGTTFCPKCQRR